jgi:hypothetical protein
MSSKIIKKIKSAFSFSIKLTLLTSFLVSQSFLTEIFLYQNNQDNVVNIAQADTAGSWYDSSWSYRRLIDIPHAKIPHTDSGNINPYLSNFPVLISINIPISKVRSDHNDIIFVSGAGALPLNYETENYDRNGNLVAWVKLPKLNDANNNTDTSLYVYYGNSGYAAVNNTSASVWNSDFKGVWHLQKNSNGVAGDYKDSTVNANDSTNNTNEPSLTTGQIDGAESFNGNSQYVDVGNKSSLNPINAMTVSVWMKATALENGHYIINKWNGTKDGYALYMNYNNLYFQLRDGNYGIATGVYVPYSALSTDWIHIVGTYDNVNGGNLYINGVPKSQYADVSKVAAASSKSLRIGASAEGTNFFSGSIDEVRISDIARSADWVRAEYDNEASPSAFLTSAGEESYANYNLSPALVEVTPVPNSTGDTTPSYTFSSTKPAAIAYKGDCSSPTVSVAAGNNTITFNTLSFGTHSNCTIQATDGSGNPSNILSVSSFTVSSDIATYIVPAVADNKILPKSPISSSYLSDTLSTQVSLGEYKSASFVVNSNTSINSLQVEMSNLTGEGNTMPNNIADIKAVKCWYQGGINTWDYSVSGRYLTPDLLLKDDSLVNVGGDDWTDWDITNPDGKNYLKVNGSYIDISSDTQVQDYHTIQISDRPIQDAAVLQPINLPANYNKQFWITFHVPDGTRAGSYAGTVNLKSGGKIIKMINVNLQVLPITLPKPNIEYSIYYRGNIKGSGSMSSESKTVQQYTAEQTDMLEHGITNPTIYPFGTDANLLQELSIRRQAGIDNTNMYYVGSLSASDIPYYKNLTTPYGVVNLYQYGPDELSMDRNQIESEHNAGGKHFNAEWDFSLAYPVADTLDLLIAGYLSPELAAKYHSYGHKVYSYNNPQIVPDDPRLFRANYGLKLWQNNYDGVMDYAYQQISGPDIWNDFDNNTWRDFVFAYPTMNGVVDTIKWEGFREGVNDMRYLTALQNAISSAKIQGKNTSEAENYITQLKSSDLTNQDLDAIRSQMIRHILSLTSSSTSGSGSSGSGSSSSGGSTSSGSGSTTPTTTIPSTTTPSLSDITQIIISYTPDFKNASWQTFDLNKFKTIDQITQTLYVKLKTKEGKISDTIIYVPKSTSTTGNTTPSNTITIPLTEGDIVKTINNPDVYIIKYKNNKQYKRLILSPSVFKSYQHLKWSNLKIISQSQLDTYTTSNLVYLSGDKNIYSLTPYGDEGERRILSTTQQYDQDSVYEINKTDKDSYKLIK